MAPQVANAGDPFPWLFTEQASVHRPPPMLPGKQKGLSLLPRVPRGGTVEEGQTDVILAEEGSTYSEGGTFPTGFER